MNQTDFPSRARALQRALCTGDLGYAEARRRLLDLLAEYRYARWCDAEPLASDELRRYVRAQFTRNAQDHGHPLLPLYPTLDDLRTLTEEAAHAA